MQVGWYCLFLLSLWFWRFWQLILFARTITLPLTKVTQATRVLTSGDYSARVMTSAGGELGELAHNFNDMAKQLQIDVEELRKQEIWRRELIMSITHDLEHP